MALLLQRTLATALVGMSNPMGIVLGQGLTPLLVNSKDDVPLMNIVWFIPAGLGSILTMWKVKSYFFFNLTCWNPGLIMALHC